MLAQIDSDKIRLLRLPHELNYLYVKNITSLYIRLYLQFTILHLVHFSKFPNAKLSSDIIFSDYYGLLDTDQNGSISLAEIEENYAKIYREVGKTKVANLCLIGKKLSRVF